MPVQHKLNPADMQPVPQQNATRVKRRGEERRRRRRRKRRRWRKVRRGEALRREVRSIDGMKFCDMLTLLREECMHAERNGTSMHCRIARVSPISVIVNVPVA
jgi:hypothetical protein